HGRPATETEERHARERDEEVEKLRHLAHHARLSPRPTAAPATMSSAGCTGVNAATRNAATTSATLRARPVAPRKLANALGANAIATPSSNAMTTGRTPANASCTRLESLVAWYSPPSRTIAMPDGKVSPNSAANDPVSPATRHPK